MSHAHTHTHTHTHVYTHTRTHDFGGRDVMHVCVIFSFIQLIYQHPIGQLHRNLIPVNRDFFDVVSAFDADLCGFGGLGFGFWVLGFGVWGLGVGV